MIRLVTLCFGLLLMLTPGCGSGPKMVPVSGTVTLDGQPLANALVGFEPIPPPGGETYDSSVNSSGKTNDKGEYTLSNFKDQPGAIVGKHRVRINCMPPVVGTGDERRSEAAPPPMDKVPPKYNQQTTLEFDVPPGGTKEANFKLTSE